MKGLAGIAAGICVKHILLFLQQNSSREVSYCLEACILSLAAIWKLHDEFAQCSLEKLQRGLTIDVLWENIPETGSFNPKRVVVTRCYRLLSFVTVGWYCSPRTKSERSVKCHSNVVRNLVVQYLPHVDDSVAFSPPLEGQELQFLKALPVVQLTEPSYPPGELFLNIFN